jgi:hypothetical protein
MQKSKMLKVKGEKDMFPLNVMVKWFALRHIWEVMSSNLLMPGDWLP